MCQVCVKRLYGFLFSGVDVADFGDFHTAFVLLQRCVVFSVTAPQFPKTLRNPVKSGEKSRPRSLTIRCSAAGDNGGWFPVVRRSLFSLCATLSFLRSTLHQEETPFSAVVTGGDGGAESLSSLISP